MRCWTAGRLTLSDLIDQVWSHYRDLKFPGRAVGRDLAELLELSAIALKGDLVVANLDWPQQFSESELLEQYEKMPSAASANHPAMAELSGLLSRRR